MNPMPLVLHYDSTLSGPQYRTKTLTKLGFDVFEIHERLEAIKLSGTRGKEIRAVLMNLDMPLHLLHHDELINGKHPLVHVHDVIRANCHSDIPSIFVSAQKVVTPEMFGVHISTENFTFISLFEYDPFELAEQIKVIISKSQLATA